MVATRLPHGEVVHISAPPAAVSTIREYALSLLEIPTLASKLAPAPSGLDDSTPGQALRVPVPARPEGLGFSHKRVKMPKLGGLHLERKRGVALHRFANHELQAIEIMAWALLAFPDAPKALRRGLVQIIKEEQLHMGLYMARCVDFSLTFGELPVNDYFWKKVSSWTNLLHYVAAMSLTFEAANLDFAQDFEAAFRAAGDDLSADIIAKVHSDEIGHVRFGVMWMKRLAEEGATQWDAFVDNLVFPLHPARARGKNMDLEARRAAGMDDAFLETLAGLDAAIIARELGRRGPGRS